MLPAIVEATEGIDRLDPLVIIEQLLFLAMPVTYIWLLMFYLLFHLFLNFLAELLRFGDRVFYKDWWNATTVEKYWQLWNLPVHYWMIRHLYFPCLRAGLGKNAAVFACFLFSALLHELLVSIPFHMPRLYAFGAMLGQIPLVQVTKILEERWSLWKEVQAGNITFWVSFCIVGQPMAVLLYYFDAHLQEQQINAGCLEKGRRLRRRLGCDLRHRCCRGLESRGAPRGGYARRQVHDGTWAFFS